MTRRAGSMATARAESPEVRYATDSVVIVGADDIAALKADAGRNVRTRARLCAHGSVDAALHEMVIVHTRGTYVRPHKHLGKSESFHVIEGTADVVLFDDAGDVADVISMGPFETGQPFYYRISTPTFHTLLITSEVLVFHEVTGGPFRRGDTVFAPWAPDDGDATAVRRFMDDLQARLSR